MYAQHHRPQRRPLHWRSARGGWWESNRDRDRSRQWRSGGKPVDVN